MGMTRNGKKLTCRFEVFVLSSSWVFLFVLYNANFPLGRSNFGCYCKRQCPYRNFSHGNLLSSRKSNCDIAALSNHNLFLTNCMQYFLCDDTTCCDATLLKNFLRQMDMGSLTRAQICLRAVHMKGGQAQNVCTRVHSEWQKNVYDNSTWHAISTGYINSTKETPFEKEDRELFLFEDVSFVEFMYRMPGGRVSTVVCLFSV